MNVFQRQLIVICAGAVILAVGFYGNLLPLRKSYAFIAAVRSLQGGGTLREFADRLSVSLRVPSPIGQEELVRNTAGLVAGILAQQGEDKKLTAALVAFIEAYYQPILARGRGMSFAQNFYVLGQVHEVAFVKTKDRAYLESARRYYERGLALSPERPQFLYGLYQLAQFAGDQEAIRSYGERILRHWPGDQSVRQAPGTL